MSVSPSALFGQVAGFLGDVMQLWPLHWLILTLNKAILLHFQTMTAGTMPTYFRRSARFLEGDLNLSGVSGRSMSEMGVPSAASSPSEPVDLNYGNLFRGSMAISILHFFAARNGENGWHV